jgi:hypothetical protein
MLGLGHSNTAAEHLELGPELAEIRQFAQKMGMCVSVAATYLVLIKSYKKILNQKQKYSGLLLTYKVALRSDCHNAR